MSITTVTGIALILGTLIYHGGCRFKLLGWIVAALSYVTLAA